MQSELWHAPVWCAVFISAGCRAFVNGRSRPVQWEFVRNRLRYSATRPVVLKPINVTLSAGEVIEVQWEPGKSEYTVKVKGPRHPRGVKAKYEW